MGQKIQKIHAQSGGAYGSPRVFQALRQSGEKLGEKRVERLMRQDGLMGRCAIIYRSTSGTRKFFTRHSNLRIEAPAPSDIDQQWVADLTYIKIDAQWFYLAVVLDVFSRRVIGWSLDTQKSSNLTLRALRHAMKARNPKPGLIFHTDRGSEYGSSVIQNELKRHSLRPSMNRPGSCGDNAHAESFFHSLKAEKLHGVKFRNERHLRQALSCYINGFYNPRRLHSGLDYVSPIDYEKLAA